MRSSQPLNHIFWAQGKGCRPAIPDIDAPSYRTLAQHHFLKVDGRATWETVTAWYHKLFPDSVVTKGQLEHKVLRTVMALQEKLADNDKEAALTYLETSKLLEHSCPLITLHMLLTRQADRRDITKSSCHEVADLPKYLGVSLDPRLNLTKHVKNVASNVREQLGIVQKVAGTSWGAKPLTLRTLYTSFVRPVLEYANPILNLVSHKSLETLDKVQNAALRLITGGLQSTPISVLEAATGCEPLGLRREVQTVKTLEEYLRMEAGSTLKGTAENYNAQKRRLQKESVLSTAYKYAPKFSLSSNRAPLPTPCWAPEKAPVPPEIRADIGWLGTKSDATPSALKAFALEKVSSLDSSYAIRYMDGSAENGIGKGGYSVLYQWPDGTTTREAGSVGSICCSYDCEYKALLKCLKGTIRRHREVGPLPGVAILTDCQALLHNLKRAGSAEVGEAMCLIDELQRLEKVRLEVYKSELLPTESKFGDAK
ncbi:reverse transcriptase [Plakobranchus ocellatus]|uniref:Reverse transcriptase n=1 Tax=Plakobranchus ocellatus TaxID=259542 RepID=A0AAV4DWX6_9GAST|nr:reverse transcriptase [Plakobranchus ocellatus]